MTPTINLSTTLCNQAFSNPLLNASGVHCRLHRELTILENSAVGSLVTKSCTLQARVGNPEPRYYATPLGSINSMGLPNEGIDYYLDFARNRLNSAKPLFISVAGMSLDDNRAIIQKIHQSQLPVIVELNLSCPNLPGKPQIAYDMAAMEHMLTVICREYPSQFGVKLPPYFDFSHFDQAAAILNQFNQIAFLTCINSIGNALVIDIASRRAVIHPKGGFGGIGGDYVLPTALANVHAFFLRCPDKKIIGCGGIKTAEHIVMHVLAGASLVQVGTALYEQGPGIFTRLLNELQAQLQTMHVNQLSDLQGRLQACPAYL